MTFGIVASSHPLAVGGYAPEVLTDSPYAYYRLKDASGNPADSSGNSRNATSVAGTPVYNTSGGPVSDGGYMTFDGSTEYVNLGNISSWMDAQKKGSFEAWVRTSSTDAMAVSSIINDGTSTALQFHCNRDNDDNATAAGRLGLYIREDDGSWRGEASSPFSDLADGNWHHFVVTWDFDGVTEYEVYVDSVAQTGTQAGSGAMGGGFAASDYDIPIGCRNIRGSIDRYFNGDIAEVAFYRTQLTSTRVAAHYAAA